MKTRPQRATLSQTAMQRIRELRKARGWTAQHTADLLTEVGCPMSRVMVAKIELDRRDHLTVDELYAFAQVFALPADRLVHDSPVCPSCGDQPPAGFRCLACGVETRR